MTNERIIFYKNLLQERFAILPLLESNAKDLKKDQSGICTSGLIWDYRFVGVSEFIINDDIKSFRDNLSKSAEMKTKLLRRFDAGDTIDLSLVSMLAYKQLFDALAAGNLPIAIALAQLMGGRSEAEKEHDLPFTRVIGYALKEAVLNNGDSARKELIRLFAGPDEEKDPDEDQDEGLTYKDFRGYGNVLDGIAARNERVVDTGLSMVIEGHIRQVKTGIFRETEDECLCVWGLGLANLARSRGIPVSFDHELIPKALII